MMLGIQSFIDQASIHADNKSFLNNVIEGRAGWLFDNLNNLAPVNERQVILSVRDFIQNIFNIKKNQNTKISYQDLMNSQSCIIPATAFLVSLLLSNVRSEDAKTFRAIILISVAMNRKESDFDRFAGMKGINRLKFHEVVTLYALYDVEQGGKIHLSRSGV